MVDVHVVDDDVAHVLHGDAAAAGNVDVGPAAVDGLVGVEDELLLELDEHVGGEDDPEGLRLDDRVAEGARFGVDGVEVGGVGHDVVAAAFAAERVLAEADCAVGEALAVELPVRVTAPAVVDGVAGEAGGGGVGEHRPTPRHRGVSLPANFLFFFIFFLLEKMRIWKESTKTLDTTNGQPEKRGSDVCNV
ncbi:aliphatic sulfonates import ATP-binding protein SsuB [Striga asiatica]|uniref:Aliphatic sulfonates import ATP-binding protein SsuB n=1 Tax=Striga asiatica TaxID=4170 RepID=A0A5A7RAE9_STRAF|nr:aliphatic sulfonates import ATP-binding protein SsuB [Striga asiatica]